MLNAIHSVLYVLLEVSSIIEMLPPSSQNTTGNGRVYHKLISYTFTTTRVFKESLLLEKYTRGDEDDHYYNAEGKIRLDKRSWTDKFSMEEEPKTYLHHSKVRFSIITHDL